VVVLFLLGVYAPFLVSEQAYWWQDEDGWRLPLLTDLFNRWSYAKHHDLFFNVAALVLPPLLLAAWALRRRLPAARRRWLVVGGLLLTFVGCLLPLIPTKAGMQPLWRHRPASLATISDFRDRMQAITDWSIDNPDTPAPPAPRAAFPPIPHRFDATFGGAVLAAPGTVNQDTGARFWFGCDSAGRDVLARLLFGIRVSLTIGVIATGLSLLMGTIIGAVSGFFGGVVDLVLQRVVEIMMCFPTFILILVVVAMLGRDLFIIMMVIGLTGWAGTARLVRGEFLAQSVRDYVLAARASGVPSWRIMFRHILPNALTPLLISATFGIAGAVGAEAGLSFLGLGDPEVATWGAILEQGRNNIEYGWLIWAPGLAVFAVVLALNVVGNALRESLDPKSTTR
jgi:peptide/nickel transport system permease protein